MPETESRVARTRTRFRGHVIVSEDGERWAYEDTGEPVPDTWQSRPCGHCGQMQTPEGHDPCLGTLPGVTNACCGHGVEAEAYVQIEGWIYRGAAAMIMFDVLRCGRGRV